MINSFLEFSKLLQKKDIGIENQKLDTILRKYSFYHFSDSINVNKNYNIIHNFKESKIAFIYLYDKKSQDNISQFYIICFKHTFIIVKSSEIFFLQDLFSSNYNLNIYLVSNINRSLLTIQNNASIINFLSKTNKNFIYEKKEKYLFDTDMFLIDEIDIFRKAFIISTKLILDNEILKIITKCLSGYLIKESYMKSSINSCSRQKEFHNSSQENLYPNDYIELRNIGSSSLFSVFLIYIIEKKELYAIKKPIGNDPELPLLMKREIDNYLKFDSYYPFLPHLYGTTKISKYKIPVIKYINGQILSEKLIKSLSFPEKITILLEIIFVIHYLHERKLIYRDLKPNNIMIDIHKDIVLIDFDRAVSFNDKMKQEEHTQEFVPSFAAPEVLNGDFSYKSDVYSFGKLIQFMMNENEFNDGKIKPIYEKCIQNDESKRPSICYLFFLFIDSYAYKMNSPLFFQELFRQQVGNICHVLIHSNECSYNDISKTINKFVLGSIKMLPETQYVLGMNHFINTTYLNDCPIPYSYDPNYLSDFSIQHFFDGRYDKNEAIKHLTIAASQNDIQAQLKLGEIFYKGQMVNRDINKSVYYFTLAANQNDPIAQYNLGEIFFSGTYLPRNINKSLFYLSMAANQNNSDAQFCLGKLYFLGNYISKDINKAIYYFKLSANQNHPGAQYYLGMIYLYDEKVERDVDKSIHYFMLASNQNDFNSQLSLGLIYLEGIFVSRDINKAIHYLSLSANLNNSYAQYILGLIYLNGEYIARDVDKSIYYLTSAAKQDNSEAQFLLFQIYLEGIFVSGDINKAIHYLSLSANLNNSNAQYILGLIYLNGEYISRDVDKSIYYLTSAAKQNNSYAQLLLSRIYFEGIVVSKDINKTIHYLSLSANLNNSEAQFVLGLLYINGEYTVRDIDKGIFYTKLAANQNNSNAQCLLGYIYFCAEYVPRDIEKALNYLLLSSNQNNSTAMHNLGCIYFEGKYIQQDINKAIYYFTLAANRNFSNSQFNLGVIYFKGEKIPQDIKKAIYYLSLATKHNHKHAPYFLGIIYYMQRFQKPENVNKAIYFLSLAAQKYNSYAQFYLGCIYYEGLYVEFDINKAIHYFKESSSFNNQYAKNNLGIIYKTGNGVQANIYMAIEYFDEAIRQKNDVVSTFNLAHIYFFNEDGHDNIEKAFELLIKSFKTLFLPNVILLSLVLVKKYDKLDLSKLIKDFEMIDKESGHKSAHYLYTLIQTEKVNTNSKYQQIYNGIKDVNYFYYSSGIDIYSKKKKIEKKDLIPTINSLFYEGLGEL